MDMIRYPSDEVIDEAVRSDKPLIAAISHDGFTAVVAPLEEAGEHSILLALTGLPGLDVRDFFRISFNSLTADWHFGCPPEYKDISDSSKRLSAYYKDGLRTIPEFLVMFGYFSKLNIKNAPPDIWDF
ncbi:MAG: hypothetical protein IKI56_01780 [Ruminococcus sp.]|nr:hypothetical protein [Ruminococcus sp.]